MAVLCPGDCMLLAGACVTQPRCGKGLFRILWMLLIVLQVSRSATSHTASPKVRCRDLVSVCCVQGLFWCIPGASKVSYVLIIVHNLGVEGLVMLF